MWCPLHPPTAASAHTACAPVHSVVKCNKPHKLYVHTHKLAACTPALIHGLQCTAMALPAVCISSPFACHRSCAATHHTHLVQVHSCLATQPLLLMPRWHCLLYGAAGMIHGAETYAPIHALLLGNCRLQHGFSCLPTAHSPGLCPLLTVQASSGGGDRSPCSAAPHTLGA